MVASHMERLRRIKPVNSPIFLFLGIIGVLFYFIVYLRRFIFRYDVPQFIGLPIFSYQCGIRIYDQVFPYPLCNVFIYSDYILITYLWSKILIRWEKIEGLYLKSPNELVIKHGNDPFEMIFSYGDINVLKEQIEKQLFDKGIKLLNKPL